MDHHLSFAVDWMVDLGKSVVEVVGPVQETRGPIQVAQLDLVVQGTFRKLTCD